MMSRHGFGIRFFANFWIIICLMAHVQGLTVSELQQGDIKAIIFDCDGVLIDSEYSHYLAWQQAIQKYGYDLTLDEYYFYVGKSGPEVAKLFAAKMGIDCADQLIKDKRAFYHGLQAKGIPPIQSTIDFVRLLANEKSKWGFSLGVASAAKKEEILLNLRQHGIEDCFDIVLSGQDDLKEYRDPEGVNKPKPYIYLHSAKMLGVSPEQCIVIEDSYSGVSAGVTAGCITIAVPNRFTQRHDLSRATLKLDSLAEMDASQFFQLLVMDKLTQQ